VVGGAAAAVVVASGSWDDVRAATARARPESPWGSARNDAASVPLVEAYVAPAGSVMFVLFNFAGAIVRACHGARDVMRVCDARISQVLGCGAAAGGGGETRTMVV